MGLDLQSSWLAHPSLQQLPLASLGFPGYRVWGSESFQTAELGSDMQASKAACAGGMRPGPRDVQSQEGRGNVIWGNS